MTETSVTSENSDSHGNQQVNPYSRRRWSQALILAEQLRYNTQLKKNEQLNQYVFDIPKPEPNKQISTHLPIDHKNHLQNEILLNKNDNVNLEEISNSFLHLKHKFNEMLVIDDSHMDKIKLATVLTKKALFLVFHSTKSVVDIVTTKKGARRFQSLNSVISYIRSYQDELPIHGRLLVDWYEASKVLDLLTQDSDWLVQPSKAYWAMQICNESIAWARTVLDQDNQKKSSKRPIYDRENSLSDIESLDK